MVQQLVKLVDWSSEILVSNANTLVVIDWDKFDLVADWMIQVMIVGLFDWLIDVWFIGMIEILGLNIFLDKMCLKQPLFIKYSLN